MRWFQHITTSNQDLALKEIIEKYSMTGYGLYWICAELVGSQGKNYRIKGEKNWKKALKDLTKLSEEELKTILDEFSTLDLINKNAYKQGDLYIPKMKKYSDDYTKRSRRVFGQGSDNVRQAHLLLFNVIKSYFVSSFKERFKKEPSMDFGKDAIVVKKAMNLIKTEAMAKDLIDQFLNSEKGLRCGYSLAICFSSHTLNLYFAGQLVGEKKKPFFKGMPMTQDLKSVLVDGEWKPFAGSSKDIEYK